MDRVKKTGTKVILSTPRDITLSDAKTGQFRKYRPIFYFQAGLCIIWGGLTSQYVPLIWRPLRQPGDERFTNDLMILDGCPGI